MSEWTENGSYGACEACGRRTWIESGCARLCEGCDYGDEPHQDNERDTLASLGMCESDFR